MNVNAINRFVIVVVCYDDVDFLIAGRINVRLVVWNCYVKRIGAVYLAVFPVLGRALFFDIEENFDFFDVAEGVFCRYWKGDVAFGRNP